MIYFIQDDTAFLIKIGFTDDADAARRLAALQTGSPAGLILLGTIPGDLRIEGLLHDQFATVRHHGEWFKPHPDLLRFIIEATSGGANEAVRQRDVVITDLVRNFNAAIKLLAECGRGKRLTRQMATQFLAEHGANL